MREFFIKDNGPCCVEKAFKMIGARWTPRILELCYLHSGMDLREFRQEIPALTFSGYFDREGNAHSHLETNEFAEKIEEYQIVQYQEMFGTK